MNSQWLTILKSRISETIEQNSIFDSPKVKVKSRLNLLSKQLQMQKKQISNLEISDFLEEISPAASREALSLALNFLRPFAKSIGFRVTHLTAQRIEILIPFKKRIIEVDGTFHEGIYSTVAIEALRLLWSRSVNLDVVKIQVSEIQLKLFSKTHQNMRLRFELSEKNREAFLMQLRHQNYCHGEADFYFYDEQEKNIARLQINYQLLEEPVLLIQN